MVRPRRAAVLLASARRPGGERGDAGPRPSAALGDGGSGVGGNRATGHAVRPGSGRQRSRTPRQWGLARIGAPAAWGVATGVGTTIAIVDSGIDADHPDLQGKVRGGANCVGRDVPGGCVDGDWADDAGHGTHVAGIAAAITGNGQGSPAWLPGRRCSPSRC